ncbi:hypothetical protein [Aquabacterium sp. A08]|uniref:hypothetical protein n=1 Tax=Aquabacterium sp. A08 TaxID=2718532 RepID=UPI00141DDFFF|nr:hypothetical protein [Aquabacterium sp. A08]NIC42394.1 hypothetical protein [Aquabacterium sp. A08]
MTPSPAYLARQDRWAVWLRRTAWVLALAVLLGIFSVYTHPDFMVDLADKLWSCF